MTEKTAPIDIYNSFEMLVRFPKNLIFREFVFLDTWTKDAVKLMHKHGVRYFRPLRVLSFQDERGLRVVFGRILRWEAPKIHDILLELQETNQNSAYDKTCEDLRLMMKEFEEECESRKRKPKLRT